MSNLKRWLRDLLGFSGTETNAFIILLPLMAIIIFAQPVYHRFFNKPTDELATSEIKLDSMITRWSERSAGKLDSTSVRRVNVNAAKLFLFDPNTATTEQFNTLGFSSSLTKRILNYRRKGGTFKIKSHLLKIYGMDTALYKRLQQFISLPDTLETKQSHPRSLKADKLKFNLNTADTATLEGINGIGPVLAARIIKYRTMLGGFIKPEQLKEVYGLDSIVVHRLLNASVIDGGLHQININEADEAELDVHPYITKAMAKAIVAYRFQHGKFKTADDIRNVALLKGDVVAKIIPYLKTE